MEVNFWVVPCILATWVFLAVNGAQPIRQNSPSLSPEYPAPARAPASDCSTLIYNMANCLSFLNAGSNETTPDKSCCSGLKLVIDTDAKCLCEALHSIGEYGLVLNMTKAITLPTACGISSAPPISSCNASMAPTPSAPPGATPAYPPSPSSPPSEAPVPDVPPPQTPAFPVPSTTPGGAPESPAPTPSPLGSKAYIVPISFPLLFSMVIASLYYMSYELNI